MPPIAIDPAVVERYILALAEHGACAETGVCRPAYTPQWADAQATVMRWSQEAGLTSRQDAVGNVWSRLEGTGPGPVIATGSHIDSQMPGGRYDGALGVIGGLLALKTLRERFGPPKHSIELVSFAMEEGSRFPRANFWSSRAALGLLDPAELDSKLSYDGETMRAVLTGVGLDPAQVATAKRDDIGTFLELHIEQGPILEEAGLPVGIVDAITGSFTFNITIGGRSDHAGAFPMDLRRDPMVAVAQIIDAMLATARRMGRPAVTTIGRMLVEPNYGGIVPARVQLTVNARHPYPDGYQELRERHEATLAKIIADNPNLEFDWTLHGGPPTACSSELVQTLEAVASEQGIPAMVLPSGGGHDSQIMAQRCQVAMIFVQSRDGRSHTPEEYTAPEHAALGIQVLAAALHRLAYT